MICMYKLGRRLSYKCNDSGTKPTDPSRMGSERVIGIESACAALSQTNRLVMEQNIIQYNFFPTIKWTVLGTLSFCQTHQLAKKRQQFEGTLARWSLAFFRRSIYYLRSVLIWTHCRVSPFKYPVWPVSCVKWKVPQERCCVFSLAKAHRGNASTYQLPVLTLRPSSSWVLQ